MQPCRSVRAPFTAIVGRYVPAFALIALTAPAALGQTTVVIDGPAGFSGLETLIEFEGFAGGTQITTQYQTSRGVTFGLAGGGGPTVISDSGTRVGGPQGSGAIRAGASALIIDLDSDVFRIGFDAKSFGDNLDLELRCCLGGTVIATRSFAADLDWSFVGVESDTPFDQVIVEVSGGAVPFFIALDNLRFDCFDTVVPDVTLTSGTAFFYDTPNVELIIDVLDTCPTRVTSSPGGISASLPAGGDRVPSLDSLIVLPEGTHLVSVNATDSAGNVGGATATATVDLTAPTVEFLSPTPGSVVTSSPVTVTLSVVDDTDTIVLFGGLTFFLPPGGGTIVTPINIAEGSTFTSILVVDKVGHNTLGSLNLTLDTTAPVIRIDSPADGACFGPGDSPLAVLATVDDVSETTVVFEPGGASEVLDPGGGVATGTVALLEGPNTIRVTATDTLGLASSQSIVVTLDATPPDVTVILDQAVKTIDVEALAADPGGSGVVRVDFVFEGSIKTSFGPGPLYAPPTPFPTPLDGEYTILVRAIDLKSNFTETTFTFIVDNTPPVVEILDPLDATVVVDTIRFDALVTDAGSGVQGMQMQAAGAQPLPDDGSAVLPAPQPEWIFSSLVDTRPLLDGPLVLTATGFDAAGNTVAVTVLVTVDNGAPASCLRAPVQGEVVRGTIDIVAEAQRGGSLQIYLDGIPAGPASASSPVVLTVDTRDLLDGALTVSVVESADGTESYCSARVTVDNIQVRLGSLKKAFKNGTNAGLELRGENLALLLPLADHRITLNVPGASPVPLLLPVGAVGTASIAASGPGKSHGDDEDEYKDGDEDGKGDHKGDDEDDDDDEHDGDEGHGDEGHGDEGHGDEGHGDDDDGAGPRRLFLSFDRGELAAAIESGIAAGKIDPASKVEVRLIVDGHEIGSDRLKVKRLRL